MSPQDQQDFLDAVKSLTEPQKLTLYNFSAKLLDGTRYSNGMDLLYEVIDRVLSGSRRWNSNIPIGAFLHECMRSVASVDWRRPGGRPISYEDWMDAAPNELRDSGSEFASSPEEMLMKRQEEEIRRAVLEASKNRLARNDDAQALFKALAAEMTPAEARDAHGLSERAYKAARERITKDIRIHGRRPRH